MRIPQSTVPPWYSLMMMAALFYGILVGFVCAKAYSINIRAISPKNLLGPPYVQCAFPEIEYMPKYSLRVV